MATQFGDAGNNSLNGTTGNDTLVGLDGNDTVNGVSGNDLLYGNTGDDVITAGDGFNTVYGGQNNDQITAGNGNNLLFGDEGSDTISAGNGNNTIVGGVDSTDGADLITVGNGNDLILGNGGDDTVGAGAGNDSVVGGFGDDVLLGNQGNDLILGNQGQDVLYGGDGSDTLYGGQGNDVLVGGEGNDVLYGNEGDDTAVFSGTRASYTITQNTDGSFVLTGASGSDTVSTVEHFQFDDGTVDAGNLVQGTSGGGGGSGGSAGGSTRPTPAVDTLAGRDTNGQITFTPNILDNDTPNGGGLEVASVSHVTAQLSDGTVLEATPVMPQQGQVASYNFGNGTASYNLVINQDGTVSATVNGSQGGKNVIFGFDYQDENANGTSNNTAHVTATETGTDAAPGLETSNNDLVYSGSSNAEQIDNRISITDADGRNLTAANVQITDGYQSGDDLGLGSPFTLSSAPEGGGTYEGYYQIENSGYTTLYVKFDSNTATLMIKGEDTHLHYENVLEAVTYSNKSGNSTPRDLRVTFTGVDEDGVSSVGATNTDRIFVIATAPSNNGLRAEVRTVPEGVAASGNSYVFTPHAGHQTIAGFVVGGPTHDTLELPSSDFHSFAAVLRNTDDVNGSAAITDPKTGGAIVLAGVSTAELKHKDFTFHA